jgi:acid phosphatase (class A)
VEDAAISACNIDYLRPRESYPSGHSVNGYAAALLLAEVIPQRRQALLARGIRYGTNRVVCGVHHPSDVLEGRLLAIAYLAALKQNADFQRDLACAVREQEIASGGTGQLPPACASLHI